MAQKYTNCFKIVKSLSGTNPGAHCNSTVVSVSHSRKDQTVPSPLEDTFPFDDISPESIIFADLLRNYLPLLVNFSE
jgi:hypothetical protein